MDRRALGARGLAVRVPGQWQRRLDVAGLLAVLVVGPAVGIAYAAGGIRPVDADMVWRVAQGGIHYGAIWGADSTSRYVYPPVLAQAAVPLTALGWQGFLVAWETFVFVALWASTREWAVPVLIVSFGSVLLWGLDAPLSNPVMLALVGNLQSAVAAAIVIGLRQPAAWAGVLLTKIFPGAGVLWFVGAKRWNALAKVMLVTGFVTALSVVAAPGAWGEFLSFAVRNAGATPPEAVVPIPWAIRLPVASVVLLWAGRRERYWLVPIAAAWATPALYLWSWITLVVAALPLWTRSRSPLVVERPGAAEGAASTALAR